MESEPPPDPGRFTFNWPGFTRLVHFTPARNLAHILRDGQLRSSRDLAQAAPQQFSPTGRERFDRHPDHVCCSFEYPNAYYRDKASTKVGNVNYPQWVILTLDRDLVRIPGDLFSDCNAAKGGGRYLQSGTDALAACWASPSVPGGYRRSPSQLVTTPNDLQAEALIPGPIPLSAVTGIIVSIEEVAEEQSAILRRIRLGPDQLPWKVAPVLYDKDELRRAIHDGIPPDETPWVSAQGTLGDHYASHCRTRQKRRSPPGHRRRGRSGLASGRPQPNRRREGRPAHQPHRAVPRLVRNGGTRYVAYLDPVQAGEYSDDTQLILAVARACLHGPDWWRWLARVELPQWSIYARGGGGAVLRAARTWARGREPWRGEVPEGCRAPSRQHATRLVDDRRGP